MVRDTRENLDAASSAARVPEAAPPSVLRLHELLHETGEGPVAHLRTAVMLLQEDVLKIQSESERERSIAAARLRIQAALHQMEGR